MLGHVRERAGGDVTPAGQVCEVWPDISPRAQRRQPDGVAVDTPGSCERLQALRRFRACRLLGRLSLRLEPRLELIGRLGYDVEGHVRVLQAAVLRALAAVFP